MSEVRGYCATKAERAKNPEAETWLRRCAGDDPHAFDFCWTVWCYTHMLDDLVDRDEPVDHTAVAAESMNFIRMLAFNPFFLEHRNQLFAMLNTTFYNWLDAERVHDIGGHDNAIRASVLRCSDIQIYLHVAFLVGGWSHMLACREMRTFDAPEPPKEI